MGHILALLEPEVYNRNRIPDDDWRKLKAPTMIVAAVDHDDVFLETARVISKLIPNAQVLEVKGVSHWPQLEEPEVFNRRKPGIPVGALARAENKSGKMEWTIQSGGAFAISPRQRLSDSLSRESLVARAAAQEWPTRPLRLIVGFPPGGSPIWSAA